MNRWHIIITVLAICSVYFFLDHGRWSTKSKHFGLYKLLVDPSKAPDFSITATKGDLPEEAKPCIVTYVPPQVASKRGVKAHQIVGVLMNRRKGFVPENFSGNRAFKERIHAIAAKQIPESIQLEAKRLGAGEIRLMDDRVAPQQAEAGEEHCLGHYKVENGAVVAYVPNENFLLFSDKGPLELVESIRKVLYSELAAHGD